MDNKKKLFIGIGIFWLVLALGFIGIKEYTLKTGTEVLLKLQPVDPRDLFRGDYVILRYPISRLDIENTENFKESEAIYVRLKLIDGVAEFDGVSRFKPQEGLFIAGKVSSADAHNIRVVYGIESFFVPEGEGLAIERSISDMYAKVAIDASGNSVIKSLVENGKEITFKK